MDEQQQADSSSPLEAVPWRDNGTVGVAAGSYPRGADETWSSAGAALDPPAEPLALLTASRDPGEDTVPAPRRYAPGLDDDTPVGGTSAVEPPLWREAARHTPSLGPDYGSSDHPEHETQGGQEQAEHPYRGDEHPHHRGEEYGNEHPAAEYSGRRYAAPDYGPPEPPDADSPGRGYHQPEYGGQGYAQAGFGQPGYAQPGHTQPGVTQPGHAQRGYGPPEPGYAQRGYGQPGFGQPGHARQEYNTPREPAQPPREFAPPGFGARLAASEPDPAGQPEPAGLPQRVPSEPDVPELSDTLHGARERWAAHELAWIADQLRRVDVAQEPTEWLDVDAVLEAVRRVDGVRDASVRSEPSGAHTLRLDLSDDADPGQVSRLVARMLEERMGLSAAPQPLPSAGAPAPGQREPEPPAPEPASARMVSAPPAQPASPVSTPPYSAVPQAPPGLSPPAGPPPVSAPPASGTRPPPPPPPLLVPSAPPEPAAPEQFAAPEQPLAAPEHAPPEHAAPEHAPPEHAATAAPSDLERPGNEPADQPEVVSRPLITSQPGPRVVIDEVRVSTLGLDAVVEVRLTAGAGRARGLATGPAVDSYVMRLSAVATARAIDGLLRETGHSIPEPGTDNSRCFIEHTGLVPFGSTEVAVVVLLLVCGGWVEQLTGSALVDDDPRQAMVRATLGAVNRRLEALLG